jgi:tRNA C32,U32 (ribose-2'-O)-methylase TrmJ
MGGVSLADFKHPPRAVYVLGSEDNGLPNAVREACQHIVTIPAVHSDLLSYNVAVAGSLLMYDRAEKRDNFAHSSLNHHSPPSSDDADTIGTTTTDDDMPRRRRGTSQPPYTAPAQPIDQ